MNRKLSIVLLALMCALLLTGCGKSADSVSITYNGGEITTVGLVSGEERTGFRAAVLPTDYAGEIVWSSNDENVVSIGTTDGNQCSLIANSEGSAAVTVKCGSVSASISVQVFGSEDGSMTDDSAIVVNGKSYTKEEVTLAFADQYYSFIQMYGDYAESFGLDVSAGIENLSGQACQYSTDGTWYGYFLETSVELLEQTQALCDYAAENGIELTDEDKAYVDLLVGDLTTYAKAADCADEEEFLTTFYGKGITVDMYRTYMENTALADRAYKTFTESLSYTDEEIAEHYAELGYAEGENDYPVTAMRHVLIMAEPTFVGDYTEEAIQAAHDKAEELYNEWLEGDRTEESFAELANTYSDDGGSNTSGGLYEDIYKDEMVDGINEWLFDEGRTVGDTAVIDNNGSYVGTHIVYFAGFGEPYGNIIARQDLETLDTNDWFGALLANYSVAEGPDYPFIGNLIG